MTPIIWNDETLRRQGARAAGRSIVELQPAAAPSGHRGATGRHQEPRTAVVLVLGPSSADAGGAARAVWVPHCVGTIPAAIADWLLSRGLRVTGRR